MSRMDKKDSNDKYRRRIFGFLMLAGILITAISGFTQAGTNRPLRYYTDNGTTAMTYYTTLANNTTVSGWGINTDYPVCEFQVGDNGSSNWLCMNKTNYYTCSGSTCSAVSAGSSDGNNYTYAQEINQSGNTYTLYTYRNGISVPLTSSFTVTPSNGSGGSNVSFVNALNGYPLKMNGTSDVTIFNVSCDYFNGGSNSGYGFIDINNNSGCGLFLKSEIDGSITNEIQNLWATINGNTGSTTASTSTDTLTIQGSGGTHVSIAGDTVTITSNVSLGGGGNLTSIANDGYILYQKNGTIINGTVMFYNESTGQIVLPAGGLTLPTITANDVDTGISINGSEVFISVNGAQKAKINANGIALNDGTLSAYAYAFQSDVNVGMRLIRSDNIGIGTGGTDALDINNTIVEVNRNMTVRGDMNITSITYAQDIVPRSNNTYDLGSSSRYWRDLYLSNSTIYMNGWTIRSDANYLYYNGASLMTVAYGINSFLNISDQRYNETTLINNVINNVTSINQSKADISYVYRVEASLNFTNNTANSANTSIGYLNSTKAASGSCGTGNTVVQNSTSTGVQCLTLSAGSGSPGGSSGQIQINNAGSFGGNSNLTLSLDNGSVTFNNTVFVNANVFVNESINVLDSIKSEGYPTFSNNHHYMVPMYLEFWQAIGTASFSPLAGQALSSGTIAVTTANASHPGVVRISDSTTANGGYRIYADITTYLINGSEKNTVVFRIPGTRTTTHTRVGWQDSATIGTAPTDGAYFNISGMVLGGATASNSVRTLTSTTYTMTAGTWYEGEIIINSTANNVTFNLYNEAGTNLWNSSITSNIPIGTGRETGFGVYAGETSTDAAAPVFDLDYLSFMLNRKLNR